MTDPHNLVARAITVGFPDRRFVILIEQPDGKFETISSMGPSATKAYLAAAVESWAPESVENALVRDDA